MSKVYLVGAGFGTPDYLTLKAVELLKNADCVLYDALLQVDCLNFCSDSCEKIFVGKRKSNHHLDQFEINRLLLESAQKYTHVVRLKGGTPTVFGRGFEEMEYLRSHGIESEFIPGVSSSTGVPESFGIPIIDRNHNDAFRVITGHVASKLESILTPYQPRENLMILMGAGNARKIVDLLLQEKSYPPEVPIAFLCHGGHEDAQKIVMRLQEAAQQDEGFFQKIRKSTPLIIFVGQTAAL